LSVGGRLQAITWAASMRVVLRWFEPRFVIRPWWDFPADSYMVDARLNIFI